MHIINRPENAPDECDIEPVGFQATWATYPRQRWPAIKPATKLPAQYVEACRHIGEPATTAWRAIRSDEYPGSSHQMAKIVVIIKRLFYVGGQSRQSEP